MIDPTSWKGRLRLAIGVWVAGLVLGLAMFFGTDWADREWYLLAMGLFPTGLLAPLMNFFNNGLPHYVVGVLWGMYLVVSGWLVWVKNPRMFWGGLTGFALVVVLNIGGCAYVIHH